MKMFSIRGCREALDKASGDMSKEGVERVLEWNRHGPRVDLIKSTKIRFWHFMLAISLFFGWK